jgi:Tol biopolymer transport system component
MLQLQRFAFTLLFLAALMSPGSAQAPSPSKLQSPLGNAIRTLFAGKTFAQVAISPDGKRVAWVENTAEGGSAIYVSLISGAEARRVTAGASGKYSEDSIAWSPDSQRLAFLSDAQTAGSRSFT